MLRHTCGSKGTVATITKTPPNTWKAIIRKCGWPVKPLAGLINTRYSGCGERQVTGLTRSYSRPGWWRLETDR